MVGTQFIDVAQKLLKATESTAFLIGEIIFCVAFLSVCEIPNWTMGPYKSNECVDRWMFTAGLFVPSGLQSGIGSTSRTRRPTPRTDPDTI